MRLRFLSQSQKPLRVPNEFPSRDNRTAILVVHGIGAQKPYATLDQFGRGLRQFFGPQNVKQQICFRRQPSDPVTRSGEWTQAYLRLTPADQPEDEPDQIVDVYEYYWAPVITDLVTARQSIRFLLLSALTPFQYLRDNLILIAQTNRAESAHARKHGDGHTEGLPKDAEGFRKDSPKRSSAFAAVSILGRELFRMLFIFLPIIALLACLYYALGVPLIELIRPHLAQGETSRSLLAFVDHWPLGKREVFRLLLFALRWLFLLMTALFLFEEVPIGRRSVTRSPLAVRIVMGALFTVLLFGHYLVIHFTHWLLEFVLIDAVIVAAAVVLFSAVLHDAVRRGIAYLIRSPYVTLALALIVIALGFCWFMYRGLSERVLNFLLEQIIGPPGFLHLCSILFYLAFALLLYFIRKFLTSAIGGLAVYLGADELSKNYAARSLILDQCTKTLTGILESHPELVTRKVPRDQYDRVLIAAHSLGSVISYDMLNRLLVRDEAEQGKLQLTTLSRIKGMLTFGCPLNKVMYFFRTRTSRSTIILERILYVLHPYRLLVPLSNDANGPVTLPNPHPRQDPFGADHDFCWLNAYSPFDLISGKMFFYDADQNRRVEHGVMPWTAHLSYWENPDLYEFFGQLFRV